MATKRIKNIDRLEQDIGYVSFVVPQIVLDELRRISENNPAKKADALHTLEFAKRLDVACVVAPKSGSDSADTADDALFHHAAARGGIIATMDRQLKRRLKSIGGCSVMSFANDSIVLEP